MKIKSFAPRLEHVTYMSHESVGIYHVYTDSSNMKTKHVKNIEETFWGTYDKTFTIY